MVQYYYITYLNNFNEWKYSSERLSVALFVIKFRDKHNDQILRGP